MLWFWVNANVSCILRNITDIILNYKIIDSQEHTTGLAYKLKFSAKCKLSFTDKYERITSIWSASLKYPRRGYNGTFKRFTYVKANKLFETEAWGGFWMVTDLISVFLHTEPFSSRFSLHI